MTITFHPGRWLLAALLALGTASAGAQILRPIVIKPILPDPETFVDISAGANHTCARKLNGKVFCWGRNDLGQSGVESSATCSSVLCLPRPSFVMVARQVDGGAFHTCAVDPNGRAFCWGSDSHGQLGNAPDPNSVRATPFPVSGNHVFNSINAGETSSCGTSPEGLFCWGSINGAAAEPSLLSANASFQQVVAGRAHACALYVVGDHRGAYCWGRNDAGQAGVDWSVWSAGTAVPFAFNSSLGIAVSRLDTTRDFTCADQVAGTVQCTGSNLSGELGSGHLFSQAPFFTATFVPQTVVARTAQGTTFTALHGVSTGSAHACALDNAGLAWCWGNGNRGQLGNGVPGTFDTPQAVAGGRSFRAIATGAEHTCAIGTDNHLYCWGDFRFGQVGNGFRSDGNIRHFTSTPAQALDPL